MPAPRDQNTTPTQPGKGLFSGWGEGGGGFFGSLIQLFTGGGAGGAGGGGNFFQMILSALGLGNLAGPQKPAESDTTRALKDTQQNLAEAGLYPGPGNSAYRDGVDGVLTQHGLKLAQDPTYAQNYMKGALHPGEMSREEVSKMQAALNRLGYTAGEVDGRLDTDTRAALDKFLVDNPTLKASLAPEVRADVAPKTGVTGFIDRTIDSVRDFGRSVVHPNADAGHASLNPALVTAMSRNPEIAHYVELTRNAAARNGIDGNMLANQFWQESRFNPNAKSPVGAEGIAQFMPATGSAYGLNSAADRRDPEKAIEAGAKFMGHLTRRFGGQELALMAYNGGEKSIQFAQQKLGVEKPSIQQVMAFYTDRRETAPSARRGAWQNETYEYVEKITQRSGSEIARNGAAPPNVQLASAEPARQGAAPARATPAVGRPEEPNMFQKAATVLNEGMEGVAKRVNLNSTFAAMGSALGITPQHEPEVQMAQAPRRAAPAMT